MNTINRLICFFLSHKWETMYCFTFGSTQNALTGEIESTNASDLTYESCSRCYVRKATADE